MKRIFLLLTAALMVFTFSLAASEEPAPEPAETPAAEVPAETAAPEEEVVPQETEEIPGETASDETAPEETPSGETPSGETPPEETPSGETTPEETTPGETVPEETPSGEMPSGETTPEETTPGETAPEETPSGETPPDETIPGEETFPEEETVPAEAGCSHEHTETVYYFDMPQYRPLNDETHLVTGQAVAEVTCLDCGTLISQTLVDDAEEIQPHVFRNGLCVLCGREAAAAEAAPAPTESVIPLTAGEEPNQYSCTLTGEDLEGTGETLVLRPEGREAAIAVQTERLREEIERVDGSFTARMWKPGDRDISTALCLYDAYGEEVVPAAQGFTLRIYTENRGDPLTVSYTNLSGATSSEEARWVRNNGEEGYWIVTWLGDGIYEYR